MAKKNSSMAQSNGTALGFESKLWDAADKLRSNISPGEYKDVVLGLIFLKYISDSFEEYFEHLNAEVGNPDSEWYVAEPEQRYAVLEDPDEYLAENIFWVPKEARWSFLQANAKSPEIGRLIDDAMHMIEKENPMLKGVLPKDYSRASLDKKKLGGLIDIFSNVYMGEGDGQDVLGRVYEYFLSRFASAEGRRGGEFFTPPAVVKTLVAVLAPYEGRIMDPCCGSGGMFIQSERFVEAHGGRRDNLSVYGQESNPTTWRLAKMNLAIRGVTGALGKHPADSFLNDLHKTVRADYILANPPFNLKDWGAEHLQGDARWKYGIPPKNNANFAWMQHMIHHLTPTGRAGIVLANGSMSSNTSGEGEIRKSIIEDDLVDCMVALPGQLFYTTQIPACLWFLSRDKTNHASRDRCRQILFIDARKMGMMTDRTHRDLTDEDIERIAGTYHAWRGDEGAGEYEDVPGFCRSVTVEEVAEQGYVLTPGRYVGAEDVDDDGEPFEERIERLTTELGEQLAESSELETEIRENMSAMGYTV